MTLSRHQYALAASIAALMVAAPLAFHLTRSPLPGSLGVPADDLSGAGGRPKPVDEARIDSGRKPPGAEKETAAGIAQKEEEAAAPGAGKRERKADAKDAKPGDLDQLAAAPLKSATANEPARDALGLGKERETRSNEQLGAAQPPAEADKAATIVAPGSGADLNALATRHMFKEKSAALARRDGRLAAEQGALTHSAHGHRDEVDRQQVIVEEEYRDKFEAARQSPVKQVAAEPVSTFSIDVDTASYSFVRRALNAGRLPPKDSVRVEEMINYFPYAYPRPESAAEPFKPTVTVMQSPWNTANQLVHVAIKGYDLTSAERPRANLVLLIDVSGSMTPADRLPLVKNAFKMLVDELKPDDTVAVVTYASGSGVLLEPTRISDKSKIHSAIEKLGAGGSTAGAEGIQDAYRLAEANFDKSAVNRVILATDGDFNVGITNQDELKGLIERKREKGIFLSILGVGQGNYNDSLMQTLAQNGNGTAAYVDTLNEARKVLVDEASSTLFTIAKDVKVQIEWNPARVAEYRLIGYETRALAREDFNNDRVDAGDIGSGHTVTAIYEVTPAGAPRLADDLRYGKEQKPAAAGRAPGLYEDDARNAEIGFLKLRYKLPKEEASKLLTLPIASTAGDSRAETAPPEVRFSVAVSAFGQLLKGSPYVKGLAYDDVILLAQSAKGDDPFGYRAELINLVRLAKSARP